MMNSKDLLSQIESSKSYINEIWDDHKAMQDTINTDHPDYKVGSEEHDCFKNHEIHMMKLERINRLLDQLKNLNSMMPRTQIPFG